MIYCCDHCNFIFNRAGEVDACPDCGKPSIREATEEEKAEYQNNRASMEKTESIKKRSSEHE